MRVRYRGTIRFCLPVWSLSTFELAGIPFFSVRLRHRRDGACTGAEPLDQVIPDPQGVRHHRQRGATPANTSSSGSRSERTQRVSALDAKLPLFTAAASAGRIETMWLLRGPALDSHPTPE
jgi:hypothetical protein